MPIYQSNEDSFGQSGRRRVGSKTQALSPRGNPNADVPFNNKRKSSARRMRGKSNSRTRETGSNIDWPSHKVRAAPRQKAYNYDEPICVLKVELDGGENVQHISVYEGQIAEEIVDDFGRKFNLSENAKHRLLTQINS